MEDVEDGERVMNWRIWNFIVFVVHYLELFQHVVDSLRERNVFVSVEMIKDLLSSHILMSHIKGYHIKWNVSFQPQHLIKSMSIEIDVELCSRSYVSFPHSSSHYHDFLNLLLNIRICQQQDAEIRQRSSISPYDFRWVCFDSMINLLEDSFSNGSLRRSGQLHTSQTIASMHMLGKFHFSLQQQVRSLIDGNILPSNVVENVKGILSGIMEIGVSRRGGDTKQIDVFITCCIDDGKGVIQTRVTVKPHGKSSLFHICNKFISVGGKMGAFEIQFINNNYLLLFLLLLIQFCFVYVDLTVQMVDSVYKFQKCILKSQDGEVIKYRIGYLLHFLGTHTIVQKLPEFLVTHRILLHSLALIDRCHFRQILRLHGLRQQVLFLYPQ